MKNIIVILCDQLRKDYLQIYGSEAVPTPNLASLANDGIIFDNAITVSPVCAPARASMITGRYVSDHNVWTNDVPFREGLEYLPNIMNELGYATGAFGKLHHYPADDTKGFTTAILMEENRLKKNEPFIKYLNEKNIKSNNVFNYGDKLNTYYEEWIANNAINFIDKNSKTPFFAWVSFQGPHDPFDAPKDFDHNINVSKLPKVAEEISIIPDVVANRKAFANKKISPKKMQKRLLKYANQIPIIDYEIGKIIDRLKQLNIYDNTVIIFSADHGEMLGDYNLHAKGPFPFANQLNIPLVVANANNDKNVRNNMLVSNIDIPSTVLDIAKSSRSLGNSISLISNIDREWNFSELCDSAKIVENKVYRYCYYGLTGESSLHKKPNEYENLSDNNVYLDIECECLKQIILYLSKINAIANISDLEHNYNAKNKQALKNIIDKIIVDNGVRIEAHDLVEKIHNRLNILKPDWKENIKIAFPLSARWQLKAIKKAKLNSKINEFCKGKKRIADYGVYWKEKK